MRFLKEGIRFLCLLQFGMLVTSCLPTSDYGVSTPAGSEVNPAPYLGEWLLTEMLGMTDIAECTMNVTDSGSGEIAVVISDATGNKSYMCYPTLVGQQVVVSEKDVSSSGTIWSIYKVSLQEQGDILKVFPMDTEKIIQDIDSEVLSGDHSELEGMPIVQITESSSGLRSYLESQSGAFANEPVLVFNKEE